MRGIDTELGEEGREIYCKLVEDELRDRVQRFDRSWRERCRLSYGRLGEEVVLLLTCASMLAYMRHLLVVLGCEESWTEEWSERAWGELLSGVEKVGGG
jgi:hypothetical protein